jgi:multicomponent Na+:H+ antiporter subunit C
VSPAIWYALTGVALFAIGLVGLIVCGHVIRRLIGVNVMGSGVFLLLVAASGRGAGDPDPVPHAMVLTGIVVAISATALALALARRSGALSEPSRPPDA